MLPTNSVKVKCFGGHGLYTHFGLSIWEVSLDHRFTPTTRFIRGCLILFNIDDCIYRGRPLDSGIGSFRLNPQLVRQLHSSTSGVNASKRWIGHCLEDPTLNFEAPGTPLLALSRIEQMKMWSTVPFVLDMKP